MQFNLEVYEQQRVVRQRKRKDFIRRFEAVKARIGIEQTPLTSHSHSQPINKQVHIERHPSLEEAPSSHQYQQEIAENKRLKSRLEEVQRETSKKMAGMKNQITALKNTYTNQLKQIIELSDGQKVDRTQRLQELATQIKNGMSKNMEIATTNKAIFNQVQTFGSSFQGYVQQLRTQYEEKLKQFDVILSESNSKIQKMESQLNQDSMVDKALQNEALIDGLVQNSSQKESIPNLDEANLILLDKNNKIQELVNYSKIKQEQVMKIKQLSDTFKAVFENLNSQKQILVKENKTMTSQLLEIRNIFSKILGQANEEEDQEEEDQEEDDEEEDDEEDVKQQIEGGQK